MAYIPPPGERQRSRPQQPAQPEAAAALAAASSSGSYPLCPLPRNFAQQVCSGCVVWTGARDRPLEPCSDCRRYRCDHWMSHSWGGPLGVCTDCWYDDTQRWYEDRRRQATAVESTAATGRGEGLFGELSSARPPQAVHADTRGTMGADTSSPDFADEGSPRSERSEGSPGESV